MSFSQTDLSYDVVIVGAGAAGIGCGVVLKELGLERFTILERHQVGASFSRWPEEMHLITPSFPSHGFGLLDLNAVTLKTSPAVAFRREHISGKQYALYLQTVADHFELPIRTGVDVQTVEPLPQGGFKLQTADRVIRTRFVIWAAGEYQYPRLHPFLGAEHCIHNAQIRSWAKLEGDEFIIIGGYESGIDAAANLVAMGKKVGVLDRDGAWANPDTDPSVALSPYTLQRLEFIYRTGRLDIVGDADIEEVKSIPGGYAVYSEYHKWTTAYPPILCTGFDTSLKQIAPLFDWSKGYAALTEDDESTLTPGLFVSGPSVRHEDLIFCFIYKFRQRFAVIAHAIAQRLDLDPTPLDAYRQAGLFLDDLSCCSNDCIC
ncbi:NAD(P)/FAD-dependent oxidoreductase [cf. Phormidesmis sp. LEGE 11477]|uniref:NAD(P)/FAD-dependent oxidoreductase n=1 Tax=cf. Phormidesmis sp. LEGE 11477 TaxID=1828680 RepID=UPI00187F606A|nr:NAD(P)-binding domain-containing protein [cf. Phormidesmis sp. LEGE 11477]